MHPGGQPMMMCCCRWVGGELGGRVEGKGWAALETSVLTIITHILTQPDRASALSSDGLVCTKDG
jgi:hypothetical protein